MKKRALFFALLLGVLCLGSQLTAQAAFDPKAPTCSITYDFGNGNTVVIGNEEAQTMCVTNPDGSFYVDPATGRYVVDPWKVLTFVTNLQSMAPAGQSISTFQSTRGDLISIDPSQVRTRFMDVGTELQYLYSAITENRTEVRKPDYGFGNTYIEIDMTTQTLYYYQNGIAVITTPIVTGNLSAGNGTPTGVTYVNNKMTNVNLTGSNYVSFVRYWMPIIRNSIGIHDANWRSAFGGEIYKTNGSHGCINIPPAIMPSLFEAVAVGTPVILFY